MFIFKKSSNLGKKFLKKNELLGKKNPRKAVQSFDVIETTENETVPEQVTKKKAKKPTEPVENENN